MSNYYEYKVTFVGDYWDFNIRVQICLDEYTGNLSSEAKELAIEEAKEQGWVQGIVALSDQTIVTLLLAGEEVELND
jgi:hypothetical protein